MPAPVGPTMATTWPGFDLEVEPLVERLVGRVAEVDILKDDVARRSATAPGSPGGSGVISSSARSSKTRSAEAIVDWITLAIVASCAMGWLNWRAYWMNACTSPMVITRPGDEQAAQRR